MGNAVVHEAINNIKLSDKEYIEKINREIKPGGSYYNYRDLKVKENAACIHPFISFSENLQKQCLEVQMEALAAKINVKWQTNGISEHLDEIDRNQL